MSDLFTYAVVTCILLDVFLIGLGSRSLSLSRCLSFFLSVFLSFQLSCKNVDDLDVLEHRSSNEINRHLRVLRYLAMHKNTQSASQTLSERRCALAIHCRSPTYVLQSFLLRSV